MEFKWDECETISVEPGHRMLAIKNPVTFKWSILTLDHLGQFKSYNYNGELSEEEKDDIIADSYDCTV